MNARLTIFKDLCQLQPRHDSGMSLVSVMVAMVIGGIVAVNATQLISTQMRAQKKVMDDFGLTAAARYIQDNVSCQTTVDKIVASGMSVEKCVEREDIIRLWNTGEPSRVLVKDDSEKPTWIGDWIVRATCAPSGVRVMFSRPRKDAVNPLRLLSTATGRFEKDPLTRKAMNWANTPQPFDRPLCAELFNKKEDDNKARTPFGKCVFYDQTFARTKTPRSRDPNWRISKYTCPSNYPVAVSANVNPACNSVDSIVHRVEKADSGYPRGVTCNVLFYQDANFLSASDKAARRAQCQDLDMNPEIAQCEYLCCQL